MGGFWAPILVFLASRLFVVGAGVASLALSAPAWPPEDPFRLALDNPLLGSWHRGDSGWYVSIVERGYQYDPTRQSPVAFLPVYPLAAWVVSQVLGSAVLSGVVVSNASFLLALILMHRMVRRRWGAAAATRAILLLAFFPFSFYFSIMYSEALFLLLALLALYFGEKKSWRLAAAWGMLAVATRAVGLALLPALLAMYAADQGWHGIKARREWAFLALIPLGLVGFIAYLGSQFGSPLAFASNNLEAWGDPWHAVPFILDKLWAAVTLRGLEVSPYGRMLGLALSLMLFFVLLTLWDWRAMPLGYSLFSLFALLIPLATAFSFASGRYAMVAFPVFIGLAVRLHSRAQVVLTVLLSALGLGAFTGIYVAGGLIW